MTTKKEINEESLELVAGGLDEGDNLEEENDSLNDENENLGQPVNSEVVQEARRREHYDKPTVRRKKTAAAARKRKY